MAEPALGEKETPVWFGHMARSTCRALRESAPAACKEGAGKRLMEQPPSERLLVNLGGEAIAKGERGLTRGLGVKSGGPSELSYSPTIVHTHRSKDLAWLTLLAR